MMKKNGVGHWSKDCGIGFEVTGKNALTPVNILVTYLFGNKMSLISSRKYPFIFLC